MRAPLGLGWLIQGSMRDRFEEKEFVGPYRANDWRHTILRLPIASMRVDSIELEPITMVPIRHAMTTAWREGLGIGLARHMLWRKHQRKTAFEFYERGYPWFDGPNSFGSPLSAPPLLG